MTHLSALSSIGADPRPSMVLASAASGIVNLIESRGGDVDRIFGQTGLSPENIANPFNEIYLAQYCALFEEAATRTGDESFGLAFGNGFKPQQLGPLGYLAINAPTLGTAIGKMRTHFAAHQGKTELSLVHDDGIAWLSYRVVDPCIESRTQDAELSLGIFTNICRRALGARWCPVEVRFEHSRLGSALQYEKAFGAPVRFGRRTNALGLRVSDLSAEMPGHDPYLLTILEESLKERIRHREHSLDFATVVLHQIRLNLADTPPSAAKIAKIMGLSEGAFARRLRELNLSFPILIGAARQELAFHYLKNSDMEFTEIAFLLGYSELSAFSRAFRSWTGVSPRHHRESTLSTAKHSRADTGRF